MPVIEVLFVMKPRSPYPQGTVVHLSRKRGRTYADRAAADRSGDPAIAAMDLDRKRRHSEEPARDAQHLREDDLSGIDSVGWGYLERRNFGLATIDVPDRMLQEGGPLNPLVPRKYVLDVTLFPAEWRAVWEDLDVCLKEDRAGTHTPVVFAQTNFSISPVWEAEQ